MNKDDRNRMMNHADQVTQGIQYLDSLSQVLPLRTSFNNLKNFAFRSKRMIVLEKLWSIIERRNKKKAFSVWKRSLKLWKKKLNSIKKLLNRSRIKTTGKVLNKWYHQFKYEESMMSSVCHKDNIVNMSDFYGNIQNPKLFSEKYHTVFSFMINKYIRQSLKLGNNLKRVVLALKNDKTSFNLIDFTEEEKSKRQPKFLSPLKSTKNLSEYVNGLISSK